MRRRPLSSVHLNVGKASLYLSSAEGLQVDEAIRELRPVGLGLVVLDGDDVRQVGAARGAAGEALSQRRLVAHVYHRHLHVRDTAC